MTTAQDQANLPEEQVFKKVLKDGIGNVIYFGIACAVIAMIGSYYWKIGIVLAAIFGLVALLSIIQALVSVVAGIAEIIMKSRSGDTMDLKWIAGGLAVRIIEEGIIIIYILYLYHVFYK
jgi:hypothetical protein